MDCPNCGGRMIGNGVTSVVHCEFADVPPSLEVDGGPVYCEREDVEE